MDASSKDCGPQSDIHRRGQRAQPRTSFGTKPQSNFFKTNDFYQTYFLILNDLIFQARFPLQYTNLLLEWRNTTLLPVKLQEDSASQQMVNASHSSIEGNHNNLDRYFAGVQNHELLTSLVLRQLLTDELWRLTFPGGLQLWFCEWITVNLVIVSNQTSQKEHPLFDHVSSKLLFNLISHVTC